MKVALAWGGGIGSLLALDALRREGHAVTLLHVLAGRGVPDFVLEAQAAALALPLHVEEPGAADEMAAMRRGLEKLQVDRVAFGYVRGEEHAGWKVGKFTRSAGAEPMLPVRHVPPGEAARAFVEAGHRAFVHVVHDPLPRALLGRFVEHALADDVDALHGRGGWASLRTLAVDGPAFARRLDVAAGDVVEEAASARLVLSLRGC